MVFKAIYYALAITEIEVRLTDFALEELAIKVVAATVQTVDGTCHAQAVNC